MGWTKRGESKRNRVPTEETTQQKPRRTVRESLTRIVLVELEKNEVGLRTTMKRDLVTNFLYRIA